MARSHDNPAMDWMVRSGCLQRRGEPFQGHVIISRLRPGRSFVPVITGDIHVTRAPGDLPTVRSRGIAFGGLELIGPSCHLEWPALTSKASRSPGSHAVITQSDLHFFEPLWLVPLKRAPTDGPLAPPTHSALVVSGDQSPMRVISAMSSHAACAGAAIGRSTRTARRAALSPTMTRTSLAGTALRYSGRGPQTPICSMS